jgi:hypothetical protein
MVMWSYRPSGKRSAFEFVALICVAVALIFLHLSNAATFLIIIAACIAVALVEYSRIQRR